MGSYRVNSLFLGSSAYTAQPIICWVTACTRLHPSPDYFPRICVKDSTNRKPGLVPFVGEFTCFTARRMKIESMRDLAHSGHPSKELRTSFEKCKSPRIHPPDRSAHQWATTAFYMALFSFSRALIRRETTDRMGQAVLLPVSFFPSFSAWLYI
jgi:hypothetical protein